MTDDELITITRHERRVLEELARLEQPIRSVDLSPMLDDMPATSIGKIADNLAKKQLVNRHRHGNERSHYWSITDTGRSAIAHLVRPAPRPAPTPQLPVPTSGRAIREEAKQSGRIMVFGEGTLEQLADLLIGKVLPEDPKELRDRNEAQSRTIADLQARVRELEGELSAAQQLLEEQEATITGIQAVLGKKGL